MLPDWYIDTVLTQKTYFALDNLLGAGYAVDTSGNFNIILANATADTLSELHTYLAANPITIIAALATAAVETNVIGYLKQTGAAMTIDVTSDTFVNEGGFAVKYVKDLQTVIDAIIASIPS